VPNALVFITTVTHERQAIFSTEENTALLFDTMRSVQAAHTFHLLAYAVLPDHLHLLMKTEPTDNFSDIMKSIKWNYTFEYKHLHAISTPLTIWQKRFWDHVIRNEEDLARHVDYIHYNPVKHGLVASPALWKHSTFSHWLERGYYSEEWGQHEPSHIAGMDPE
jgi:putative transposase